MKGKTIGKLEIQGNHARARQQVKIDLWRRMHHQFSTKDDPLLLKSIK